MPAAARRRCRSGAAKSTSTSSSRIESNGSRVTTQICVIAASTRPTTCTPSARTREPESPDEGMDGRQLEILGERGALLRRRHDGHLQALGREVLDRDGSGQRTDGFGRHRTVPPSAKRSRVAEIAARRQKSRSRSSARQAPLPPRWHNAQEPRAGRAAVEQVAPERFGERRLVARRRAPRHSVRRGRKRLRQLLHPLRHAEIADAQLTQRAVELPEKGVDQVLSDLVSRRGQPPQAPQDQERVQRRAIQTGPPGCRARRARGRAGLARGRRDPLVERVDRVAPGFLRRKTEHLGRRPAGSLPCQSRESRVTASPRRAQAPQALAHLGSPNDAPLSQLRSCASRPPPCSGSRSPPACRRGVPPRLSRRRARRRPGQGRA